MAERLAKDLATQDNPEDEEVRESTYFRLESLGYRVGQGLAERCVNSITPPRAPSFRLAREHQIPLKEEEPESSVMFFKVGLVFILGAGYRRAWTNSTPIDLDSPGIAPGLPITSM